MRAHVDRHTGHRRGQIGAVVQIEAAQEVLVRFAVATVLGDDQPRRRLQQLARAQQRPVLKLFARNKSLVRRDGGVRRGGLRCGRLDGDERKFLRRLL